MRPTKKEMVKDIFFLATEGRRTADNFVQGMSVIDAIAENNYWVTIQRAWERATGPSTAREKMHWLCHLTYWNLSGVKGPGARANYFRADYNVFGF